MTTQFKRQTMYYKVKQLFGQHFKVTQISKALHKDPKTIRKYLKMSEEEFLWLNQQMQSRMKKLKPYEQFIKERIELCQDCSAAQIDDWLREHFSDMISVSPKTVYNFVSYVRKRYSLPKKYTPYRQYQQVEQLAYGKQVQVDFGQKVMTTPEGSKRRVYFIVMVLSRSRQKFSCFTLQPINTAFVIESMEKGFEFFGGYTEVVVLDQDCTLLRDENHGDLLLTEEFYRYVNQRKLKLHFCRKADPESKGKVENLVKYVKQNFLHGRTFTTIETLNDQCLAWLQRTANAKEHSATRNVPAQEWLIEQEFLAPFRRFTPLTLCRNIYHVRKDNTISFKGNYYSLPLGTYQGPDTHVEVKVQEGSLEIYNQNEAIIAAHSISTGKGGMIRNTQHLRDTSQKIQQLIEETGALFPDQLKATSFLEHIRKEKPRYIRDQVAMIKKSITGSNKILVSQTLDYCQKNRLYSATEFCDVLRFYQKTPETPTVDLTQVKILTPVDTDSLMMKYEPQSSDIDDYQTIIK